MTLSPSATRYSDAFIASMYLPCLPAWLPGCLAAWLSGCLAVWLLTCLPAYLPGSLAGCLPACRLAWLAGCLPERLHWLPALATYLQSITRQATVQLCLDGIFPHLRTSRPPSLLHRNNKHHNTPKIHNNRCRCRHCHHHRHVLANGAKVYECVTFAGHEHHRLVDQPGMRDRTVTIGSASKMFSLTGWRVGWLTGCAVSMHRADPSGGGTCGSYSLQFNPGW